MNNKEILTIAGVIVLGVLSILGVLVATVGIIDMVIKDRKNIITNWMSYLKRVFSIKNNHIYSEDTDYIDFSGETNAPIIETEEQYNEPIVIITYSPTLLYYFQRAENSNYYKEETFFLMRNKGPNPCKIEKPIIIDYMFGDEQMYI